MNEFVKFIREYGVYILESLTFVCFVITLFIKRRPKTLDDFLYCLSEVRSNLPAFISKVECPGNGSTKKAAVLKAADSMLSHKLGRKTTKKESEIAANLFSSDIEAILSTPQKKGEK